MNPTASPDAPSAERPPHRVGTTGFHVLSTAWHDEPVMLLPHGAAYLPTLASLLLADPHFGKAASFRASGMALPHGTTQTNLQRLNAVLTAAGSAAPDQPPERLIVLGDFFHAKASQQPEVLRELRRWRARWPDLDVTIVRGNHDVRAGNPPADLRFRVVSPGWRLGAFACCHAPHEACEQQPSFAGHIHPAVWLHGRARQRMRQPCFWFANRCAVLPSFGAFTGSFVVKPAAGDRVFVFDQQQVLEASAIACRR